MNEGFNHQSVMPQETMSFFKDLAGKNAVDATAGGGGHLRMLAHAVGDTGHVFAFDRDPRAHQKDAAGAVVSDFPQRVTLFQKPFSHIKRTLNELNVFTVDALICDLGVSSHQLDQRSRGFSFMADAPLDMRMDPTSGITAYEWLASASEQGIATVLFQFGGERKSRAIARKIKASWPIENSTSALSKLVLSAVRQKTWSRIHPATKTFQALRMAVNQEVNELQTLLEQIPDLLAIDGVAVFLSFHSVEDRLIKHAFRALAQRPDLPQFELLHKKPITASAEELAINRRARSAKLRAIKRVK